MAFPQVMHVHLNNWWSRVEEAGINQHVERRTMEIYKAGRAERISRMKKNTDGDSNKAQEEYLTQLLLPLLVLGIGYAMAGVAFILELSYVF